MLIGLRASGKSSIGAATAQLLGMRFVDLDEQVLESFGEPSVERIFRHHGEPAFRLAELVALRRSLAGRPAVTALGGGTVTAPDASGMLQHAAELGLCSIVLLDAPDEVLLARILRDRSERPGGRPPLTNRSDLEEISCLRAERDRLHTKLAHWRIDTGTVSIEDAAAQLADWHCRFRPAPS
jgi:shikimate kinase